MRKHTFNPVAGPPVTLKDIALRCGVSHVTVSRALRHDRANVSEAMIRQINEVATELGYDPAQHHSARRMVYSRYGQEVLNHVIALVFPRNFTFSPYFINIYLGIMEGLESSGFSLLTSFDEMIWQQLPPIFGRGDVDGAILLTPGAHLAPRALTRLREEPRFNSRPIVSLMQPAESCSAVFADDYAGAYAAACHLLDLGHRHILHSCFAGYQHVQRLLAFRQACRDGGLDPDRHLHFLEWNTDRLEESDSQYQAYLAAHPEITAVLAPNDYLTTQMWDTFTRVGRRIPEDLSIIGFDDCLPIMDDGGRNILTTVRVPLRDIGFQAAQLAIRQVSGMPQIEPETLVLPTELIVRGTTAPRPAVSSGAGAGDNLSRGY